MGGILWVLITYRQILIRFNVKNMRVMEERREI